MAKKKTKLIGASLSLGTCFLFTLILLVLKYTVATALPWVVVLLPMIVWASIIGLWLMLIASCVAFALFCGILAILID